MIVVDTNLVAYLWLPGESTETAGAVLRRDSDWCAPLLWRSELRNVLALYVRKRLVELAHAVEIASHAEEQLAGKEFSVPSGSVLRLAAGSSCSAYDCEFVALAEELGRPLVTTDRRLVKAFPSIAVHAKDFVHG